MMWLNADVGELADRVKAGDEDALIALLDEANVACGGHAGDDDTMNISVASCRRHGVRINAHPSYPDREGFGRRRVALSRDELVSALRDQLRRLRAHCRAVGVVIDGVKAHGALYHDVSANDDVAAAFAEAVAVVVAEGDVAPTVLLYQGARVPPAFAARSLRVRTEVFADRGIGADGMLIPRGHPGAVLDAAAAAEQARRLITALPPADSICVHGDGDDALATAAAVRAALGARAR